MADDHLRHGPEPARLLHPRRTGSAREASQHRDGSGDHILPRLRPSFSGDKHTYTSAYFEIMGHQGGSYTHVAAQHSRSGSTGGGRRQVVFNDAPEARTTSSSANFPTVGAPSQSSQPELSSRVGGSSLSKVPRSQMIRDTTSTSAVAESSPQDVDRHSCPSKGNKSNVEFGEQGLFVEQHGSHPLVNNPPVRHGRFPDSSPFRIPSSPYRDSDDNHTMRRGPRDHLEDSLLPQKDLRDLLFPGDEDDSVKRCSARGVSGFAVEDDESEDEDDRQPSNKVSSKVNCQDERYVQSSAIGGFKRIYFLYPHSNWRRLEEHRPDNQSTEHTSCSVHTRYDPDESIAPRKPWRLHGTQRDDKNGYKSNQASNPSRHSAEDRFGTEGPGYTVEPRSSTTSNDGPATEAPLRREAHRAAREPPSSSIASTTSVLNQRGVDPNALGLIPINTLPGPLYEPDFPVARVPDRESHAGFPHDNFPLNNNQSTPTRAAGGRRRSNTLPNPPTVNELDHDVSQFDDSCADYCPSTPGLYQNIDIHNRASPAAISGALSDDEGSARRRSTFRQSEDPHTPMRKGRARIFTGNLQPVSETKIVEGFRSPDGWRRAPKRPAERVLSPLSYNKGPERKRAVKRTEHKSQSGSKNGQAKGRDGAGSQNARSTMVQHIVNIADRLDGNEAAPASEDDDDESRRGYTQNASDHVKTHHRPAGPMEKQRRSGIAQLQNQREAKKEKKLPIVSSPAEK
ncbi:hypothetical protein CcaCcLH18_02033 [Colletotrichum camelliae]|nr:hypothetical protein CcaCcLH18_02033 [Colletotrichum camelliae]